MNRKLNALLGAVLASSVILAACAPAPAAAPAAPAAPTEKPAEQAAPTEAPAAEAPAAGTKKRVKLVLNGTLGDKSFFDSAQRGMDMMKNELGYEARTVELGYDRNKWEPGLEDAAATDDYDILIAGTFDMSPYISQIAPKYPNKKFWMFDAGPYYDGNDPGTGQPIPGACTNKCENVYTVLFLQNEGSYLLGVMAANLLNEKSLPDVGDKSKIGIVGGEDAPIINDFIVGFKQGFKDAGGDPDADVIVQFVGGENPWTNPAKGKEIANSMYDQGAAVVWGVAGGSGNGVFEAAVEKKLYSLGVDSDQYLTIADPAQKATIVTSMLKNVDNGLFRAAKLDAEGKLGYGQVESVGIAGDAVGVADNENYQKFVPKAVQDKVKEAIEAVKSGAVKVDTAFK